MEESYYILVDNQQQGPYTLAELLARRAAGNLPTGCYIWKEGMEEWAHVNVILPPPPPPGPRSCSVAAAVSDPVAAAHVQEPQIPMVESVGKVRSGIWTKSLTYAERSFYLGLIAFVTCTLAALFPWGTGGVVMASVGYILTTFSIGAIFVLLLAPVWGIMSLFKREGKPLLAALGILFPILTLFIGSLF